MKISCGTLDSPSIVVLSLFTQSAICLAIIKQVTLAKLLSCEKGFPVFICENDTHITCVAITGLAKI